MKLNSFPTATLVLAIAAISCSSGLAQDDSPSKIDRTTLPIVVNPIVGKSGMTIAESPPRIGPLNGPDGAPNVVVVLLDNVGFELPELSEVLSKHRRWTRWQRKG